MQGLTADAVIGALKRYRIRYGSEAAMQEDVGGVLHEENVRFLREHSLSPQDRPDFYLPESGIAIECKVGSSFPAVIKQLQRYAAHPKVRELVLVTSGLWHQMPAMIGGKPVTFHYVAGNPT